MSPIWLYSIGSVLAVSLISLIGVIAFSINNVGLKPILLYMISFSAGALLGDALIHLLPEAVGERGFGLNISLTVLSGIAVSFILEKIIHWRHCHQPESEGHEHPFAWMNLFGDGVHNFIDGLIISAAYLVSIHVGLATTLAVILHEIPQEIGDFGVLIHGGFSHKKALFMNFLTALSAVLGAVIALLLSGYVEGIEGFLVPFAAGSFIYIAGSDLIPELHKEDNTAKSFVQFIALVLGVLVMVALTWLE
ncbi:ZIP family metal transporter [Candidatus Peregrinibacteria bacterium]|nr:ZIP family metal transporter [Candidatus Peregrinibacteria bacterium]